MNPERRTSTSWPKTLAAHHNYSLDETNIADCLRRYQEVAPLTIAELWSFPMLLRVALVEALAWLATRISRAQGLREAAYLWANRLAAGARRGPEVFGRILERMESEPIALEPYFLTSLAEQLQEEEDALAPLQHWIEERLGKPLTDIVRVQHTEEAAESVSTANAFGSLRTLSRIEFAEVFESVSLVEAELRTDPGGIYPHTDFATRDRCRRAVERIARQSGKPELDIARRANALAAQDPGSDAGHVAYYLIGDGVLTAGGRYRGAFAARASDSCAWCAAAPRHCIWAVSRRSRYASSWFPWASPGTAVCGTKRTFSGSACWRCSL